MPRSFLILDAIGKVLSDHTEIDIVIEGHPDSIGSPEYNLRLPGERATATRAYLLKNFPAIGQGQGRPLPSCKTPSFSLS